MLSDERRGQEETSVLYISARVLWENILGFQLQTITVWKLLNIVSDSNWNLQTDHMRVATEIRGNMKPSEKQKHLEVSLCA